MKRIYALAALMLLSACAPPFQGAPLAELYGLAEAKYRTEAKFRTDYDPPDAPFDAVSLEENFIKLAFNSESQVVENRTVVEGETIQLLRWPSDITYAVAGTAPEDEAHLAKLGGRIGSLINRNVSQTDDLARSDIKLWVLEGQEREVFRDIIASEFGPSIGGFLSAWTQRPELPCIGMISTDPENEDLAVGFIFIKSELKGSFRRACLTEEFTQVFGLINDDPLARPSIFNDDQEFIELTRHDEYLLRVLYDPRLTAGMTATEARPLVREIVRDLADQRVGEVY